MKEPDDVPWNDLQRAARREKRKLAREEGETPLIRFGRWIDGWVGRPESDFKQLARMAVIVIGGMALLFGIILVVIGIFEFAIWLGLLILVILFCYVIRWVARD